MNMGCIKKQTLTLEEIIEREKTAEELVLKNQEEAFLQKEIEKVNPVQGNRRIMYVNSPDGLRLRDSPGLDGTILSILKDREEVEIISFHPSSVVLDDMQGTWVNVEVQDQMGWVFSRYLTELPRKEGKNVGVQLITVIDRDSSSNFIGEDKIVLSVSETTQQHQNTPDTIILEKYNMQLCIVNIKTGKVEPLTVFTDIFGIFYQIAINGNLYIRTTIEDSPGPRNEVYQYFCYVFQTQELTEIDESEFKKNDPFRTNSVKYEEMWGEYFVFLKEKPDPELEAWHKENQGSAKSYHGTNEVYLRDKNGKELLKFPYMETAFEPHAVELVIQTSPDKKILSIEGDRYYNYTKLLSVNHYLSNPLFIYEIVSEKEELSNTGTFLNCSWEYGENQEESFSVPVIEIDVSP
jgi:hypothetical protein